MYDDFYSLPAHEAEALLTDNQTYLSAIQRASVSLYHLGFKDQALHSSSHQIGEPVMKAVIPKDDQVEFLENIDRGLKYKVNTHKKTGDRRRNSDKYGINLLHQKKPFKDSLGGYTLYEKEKTKPNPFAYGQLPHFARPNSRLEELKKREIEEEAKRRKEKEKMESLIHQGDIIKEGVRHVYDPQTGKLIPCLQYEDMKVKMQRMTTMKSIYVPPVKNNHVFKGLILEKTEKYVDSLRKIIQEQRTARHWPRPVSSYLDWPKDLLRMFPEYTQLLEGEALLTVEHCCQCHEHDFLTHHNEQKYHHMCSLVAQSIKSVCSHFALKLYVVNKPLSLDRSSSNQSADIQRIGAFECQLALRPPGFPMASVHMLYSKLHTGLWPRTTDMEKAVVLILQQTPFQLLPLPHPSLPSHLYSVYTHRKNSQGREDSAENYFKLKKKKRQGGKGGQQGAWQSMWKKESREGKDTMGLSLGTPVVDLFHLHQREREGREKRWNEREAEHQQEEEERDILLMAGGEDEERESSPVLNPSSSSLLISPPFPRKISLEKYRRNSYSGSASSFPIFEHEEESEEDKREEEEWEGTEGGEEGVWERGRESSTSPSTRVRRGQSMSSLPSTSPVSFQKQGDGKGETQKGTEPPSSLPSQSEKSMRAIQSLPSLLPSHSQSASSEHPEEGYGFNVEQSRKTILLLQQLLETDQKNVQQSFSIDTSRLGNNGNNYEDDFWNQMDSTLLTEREKSELRKSVGSFGEGGDGGSLASNSVLSTDEN